MKQSIPSRSILRKVNLIIAFSLCLSAFLFALHELDYPIVGIDDANIYFVYARNLSEGYGFVYNVGGEKVEGFTSFLWTVISALASKFTNQPEIVLFIVSITLVSLGIAYTLNVLQEGEGDRAGLFWSVIFLILIFTSPRYVVWNTITLMENALWSVLLLLTTIFVIQDHHSVVAINAGFLSLSVALLLTRPESILWVLVFLTVLFLRLTFTENIFYALKSLAPSILGILICLLLLTLFRLQYFGYPLPNTYYAKVSPSLAYNLEEGTLYLIRYFLSGPIEAISILSILSACIYSILNPGPREGAFYLPFIAATGLLVPVLTGGDHFGSFRFYQNVYPITILCLICFVRRISPRIFSNSTGAGVRSNVRAVLLPGLALLLLFGFGMSQARAWAQFPPEIKGEFNIAEHGRRSGVFIQDLFSSLPRLPSVGVIAAGGIKHSYHGEIVDLVGLNNTVMAHNRGDRVGYKGHAAFEVETFFELQPEIVLPFMVSDEWQYREANLKDRWENSLAFKGLFDQPQFLQLYEYAKVCQDSQFGCKTALVGWFRKDFLENLMGSRAYSIEQYEYSP